MKIADHPGLAFILGQDQLDQRTTDGQNLPFIGVFQDANGQQIVGEQGGDGKIYDAQHFQMIDRQKPVKCYL